MGITRKSMFGYPPRAGAASDTTVRLVPFTGLHPDSTWALQTPGSSQTIINYLPLDGVLVPRSRLSSLNTINALGVDATFGLPIPVSGLVHYIGQSNEESVWLSGSTLHGLLNSTGSISRASFVSSFGLGAADLTPDLGYGWQYTQVFMAGINNNAIVAVPIVSHDTVLVLYGLAGSPLASPRYSYLTTAPATVAIGSFDNYLIAFNINNHAAVLSTRAQWCQRGNPSNWTGEGSGFEDLLEMKGNGVAVKTMGDGRVILFSNREIWYGQSAPYPAQFTFTGLDTTVGCVAPNTIQACGDGLLFFADDATIRLLPRGGGPSQIVSKSLGNQLRTARMGLADWAVFDPLTKIYHLTYLVVSSPAAYRSLALNVETGEYSFTAYNSPTPISGVATARSRAGVNLADENLYFANSTGTVYSTSSKLALENGSALTSTWRSPPIAPDIVGDYKQVKQIDMDYLATSRATLTVKFSQDGGNNFGYTAPQLSLTSAPFVGRATSQPYVGGAYPAIEITSSNTGYQLHRLDVTFNLEGRRAQ